MLSFELRPKRHFEALDNLPSSTTWFELSMTRLQNRFKYSVAIIWSWIKASNFVNNRWWIGKINIISPVCVIEGFKISALSF